MKSIIKKLSILLLVMMLPMTTFSLPTTLNGIEKDSIVFLTPLQLKETNLIFVEHHKLLIENKLLYEQLNNYKEDNKFLLKSDSLRQSQIIIYKNINDSLNSSLKKKKKELFLWQVGGILIVLGLLLFK